LIEINNFFGFESPLPRKKKYKDFRLMFLFILSMLVFTYSLFYPGKALIDAVEHGDIVTVRNYLESGGTPNLNNFFESNPLFLSADRGQEEIVGLLLEKSSEVNIYSMNTTPLHRAVVAKNLSIVKMLVEHGADINALNKDDKETPLDCAMFVNDSSIALYLKEHGAVNSAKLLRKE
jgi:ankyrin repeat protein